MDTEKIQGFIVYHFEKAIVVIVMLMSGFLAYSGLSKPIITEEHDPDQLTQRATQVREAVDEDHTEAIVNNETEPREPEFDIAEELAKFNKDIEVSPYLISVMDPEIKTTQKQRRTDPELSKPTGVRTQGVVATIAYRSTDGLYPLANLDPADELEVVEVKQKRSRKDDRRAAMMEEMGGMGEDMEMAMEMQMEMQMEMMGGPGAAEGAEGSGPVRKLEAENNLGVTPKTTESLANGQDEPPVPSIGLFIAGSAVIPHKELIDAYQKAFSYSEGYDPRKRDLPLYVAYEVQRADVTTKSVDQLTDADWIVRDSNNTTIWNAARFWSGFAPEVVPADYRIPGVTMWIPPIVLDPYQSIATHPLIPMKTKRDLLAEQAEIEQEEALATAGPAREADFEIDIKGGNSRAFGRGGMYEMDMDMGMDEDMQMEMQGAYSMGMRGSASAMEGKPAEDDPVDYKLLRFYDFAYIHGKKYQVGGRTVMMDPNAPKQNRKYVYRIRYAVNDPNFPQLPELQPKGKTLDTEAYSRYVTLSADAEQTQKRNFKRWSEWSDPSQPSMLPPFDQASFGSVKPNKPRMVQVGSKQVELESEPPIAEVVAESFDPNLGVFVPTLIEATEGTVLAKKVDSADVVDPITLEVKKTGEKIIQSSATVIDVEGGAPMAIAEDDETIIEPGLFLMMDGEGNLKVRDSVEEQRRYRIKSFAKERGL